MHPTTNRISVASARLLGQLAAVRKAQVHANPEALVATPAEVPQTEARRAVAELVAVVESNRLQDYYDAMIGVGDAELKASAESLFSRLPRFGADARAEDFVAAGLWPAAPRGIDLMQAEPRYPLGRQVRVETNIVVPDKGDDNAYAYDPEGPTGVTFRAKVVGSTDDAYLLAVDGLAAPMEVAKGEVYRLNDPDVVESDRLHAMRVDYDDPLLKAKVCEAALAVAPHAARLDFRRDVGMGAGGRWHQIMSARATSASTETIQQEAVRAVFGVLDMERPTPEHYREAGRRFSPEVGRTAVKGLGVGHQQATTMAAVLAPFGPSLGLEAVTIMGGLHRHGKDADPKRRLRQIQQPLMAWLEITTRPSGATFVADPTWEQPVVSRERAYDRHGDRYPTRPMRRFFGG
ncbi:MAG: hypothetical protein RIT81_25135 [Deltaproteobacteria bacterium]